MTPPLADLHCHILPALDDGATDEADAVAMARQAEADGIATVCATPHVRHDHDVRIGELAERCAALNRALARDGVAVEVVPGAEVAETAVDGLDAQELRQASLGGAGAWLLVEPAPGPLSPRLVSVVAELAAAGLRSVVAHPERHAGTDFEARLRELVAEGALIQATAAHVLDDGAGPVLVRLAGEGLVHLVGSDAHSARFGRPVAVRAAIDRLTREAGADVGGFAATAPAAILAGRAPQPSGA